MTQKILVLCAALALVGCASDYQGTMGSENERTQGTGSITNGTGTVTNGTNNTDQVIPHQGQGAESQTAPQNPPPNPENRPL